MGCCEVIPEQKNQEVLNINDNNHTNTNNYNSANHIKNNSSKHTNKTKNSTTANTKKQRNFSVTEVAEIEDFCEKDVSNINRLYRNHNRHTNNNTTNSILLQKTYTSINNKNPNTNTYKHKVDIPKKKEVKIPLIEISIDIINNRKRLLLTIVEAKYLQINTQFIINAGGLEGSERLAKDGLTIFGNKNSNNHNFTNNNFTILNTTNNFNSSNDFNFPDEETVGEKAFEIKYTEKENKYSIANLYGSGLFIKVNQPIVLKHNSVFSFVTSHIFVQIPIELKNRDINNLNVYNNGNPNETKSKIILKVLYGVNKGEEYTFNSEVIPVIRLGRKIHSNNTLLSENNTSISNFNFNNVNIGFNEENISRIQCT